MATRPEVAPKWGFAGLIRGARSFYQLLSNRRRSERAAISGTVLMTSGHAIVTTCPCSSVDISPRGIGIDSPDEMAVDAIVALHADEDAPRRLARVRYCQRRGEMYRIGLEFVARPGEPNLDLRT